MRHHMEVFFCSLCLAFAPAMAQAASAAIASVRNAAALSGNGGNGSGQEQQYENPLDKPFHPKHTYPGTNIPTNVVPIAMNSNNKHSICSAFRINKHWLSTAAHCLEDFGTKNQRVYAAIRKVDLVKKGKKSGKVLEVVLSVPTKDSPANADIYFYRQGYTTQSGQPWIKYSFAEDIALIYLEEKDSSLVKVSSSLSQLETTVDSLQAVLSEGYELPQTMVRQARAKEKTATKARKEFFGLALNDYHFFTTPPEGTFYYQGHTGHGYFFGPAEQNKPKERKEPGGETVENSSLMKEVRQFPEVHSYRFQDKNGRGSHELVWVGGDVPGISGSPIIINGFVVSNASGGRGGGKTTTPLYAPQFHQFLQQTMGKEYPKGLCLTPNFPGPLPKWEPKK